MFSSMDALPEGLPELLDLFAHSLADVRFGDLDAKVLATAASDVTDAASAMAAAERALETARAALAAAQEVLLLQANRALAYARVFAEPDEELLARVNAITLPRARAAARKPVAPGLGVSAGAGADAPAATRPRGRPRKIILQEQEQEQVPLAHAGE